MPDFDSIKNNPALQGTSAPGFETTNQPEEAAPAGNHAVPREMQGASRSFFGTIGRAFSAGLRSIGQAVSGALQTIGHALSSLARHFTRGPDPLPQVPAQEQAPGVPTARDAAQASDIAGADKIAPRDLALNHLTNWFVNNRFGNEFTHLKPVLQEVIAQINADFPEAGLNDQNVFQNTFARDRMELILRERMTDAGNAHIAPENFREALITGFRCSLIRDCLTQSLDGQLEGMNRAEQKRATSYIASKLVAEGVQTAAQFAAASDRVTALLAEHKALGPQINAIVDEFKSQLITPEALLERTGLPSNDENLRLARRWIDEQQPIDKLTRRANQIFKGERNLTPEQFRTEGQKIFDRMDKNLNDLIATAGQFAKTDAERTELLQLLLTKPMSAERIGIIQAQVQGISTAALQQSLGTAAASGTEENFRHLAEAFQMVNDPVIQPHRPGGNMFRIVGSDDITPFMLMTSFMLRQANPELATAVHNMSEPVREQFVASLMQWEKDGKTDAEKESRNFASQLAQAMLA